MKKKVLALVCAMSLVCGSALSVCAAGSVTADKVVEIVEAVDNAVNDAAAELPKEDAEVKADTSTGNIVVTVTQDSNKGGNVAVSLPVDEGTRVQVAEAASKAVVTTVANAAQNVEVKALDAEAITKPLAKIAVEIAKQVVETVKNVGSDKKVSSVATAFVADIKASSAGTVAFKVETLNNGGTTAKIDVAAARSDKQRIWAYHYLESGVVEKTRCSVSEDGVISFTMNSFSPVAIVVEYIEDVVPVGDDQDDDDDAPAADAGSNDGTVVSPKTADVSTAAAVVVVAMMSVAGLVVLKRRVRA